MLSVIKDIPDFALSSAVDKLVISSDKEIVFALQNDRQTIFDSVYIPDAKNKITILDLFSILEVFLAEHPLSQFSYVITAMGEQTISKTFKVLLCRYPVNCTADLFTLNYFLSPMANRDKITYVGRKEVVCMTEGELWAKLPSPPEDMRTASAECYYVDAQNHKSQQTVDLGSFAIYNIMTLDVSPGKFVRPGLQLLRYTVTCMNRTMTFRVGSGNSDRLGLRFRNSFGVLEYFYFNGLVEVAPQIERSSSFFAGVRQNYATGESVTYKANSGYLPTSMIELADDLARSTDVVLLRPDGADIPVIITESSQQRSNDQSELFSLQLTFVLADRHCLPLPLLPEIFDDTFDDTYN